MRVRLEQRCHELRGGELLEQPGLKTLPLSRVQRPPNAQRHCLHSRRQVETATSEGEAHRIAAET